MDQSRSIKNQEYQVKIPAIPQGMVCTVDIVPMLMHMKYEDHDMLVLKEITVDPYVWMVVVEGGSIVCIFVGLGTWVG